jgi:hypothetical protein
MNIFRDETNDSVEDTPDDIESAREQDEARLPAGYQRGSSDMTIGTDGKRTGVKKRPNPEDRSE